MSLRLKLIALFAAILTATTGVSALLGAELVRRQVQDDIKDRAVEAGKAFIAELPKNRRLTDEEVQPRLQAFLEKHSRLSAVELAEEMGAGKEDQILRLTRAPNGTVNPLERPEGEAAVPKKVEFHVDEDEDGRFWSVSFPTYKGRNHARLTLEAPLAEADALAAKETRSFSWVTGGAVLLLILAAQLVFSPLILRPISRMAEAMAQVEEGQLDVEAPVGAGKEFDLLARGFNTMLARIRGFNQELTERIEQATADVNRKNRDLGELNDLLVAARRDLTAKERLAALGQLAGTIAHELGNPLNSISGHVQLLERSPNLPPEARDDLKLVSSEVRRMTDVIRRFLDSTRGLRPAPEPVELNSLITEAVDMTLSAEARARISVSRELSGDLGAVITDPSLVRHVLTNLLANAVDAMPEGGAVAVQVAEVDGELRLSVKDTGTGISAEDRRRIFEPFYTTKARGHGTGLGLAICREIAVALKGRIDVETELGKGSTFTLALPLQRAPQPAAALVPREA